MNELEKKRLLDIVDGSRVIEGYGYDWVQNVANYLIEEGVVLEKTGHWIKKEVTHSTLALRRNQGICSDTILICSECGTTRNLPSNYCPNCGAKMR